MNLVLIAAGADNFCASTANVWQIIGWALLIFKIVIPIILIIYGMVDLGKAVVAAKDDEVKKSVTSLARRAIAAIIVFLIPTIIAFIMGFVSEFKNSGAEKDFEICKSCITRPNGGTCDDKAKTAWGNGSTTDNSNDPNDPNGN